MKWKVETLTVKRHAFRSRNCVVVLIIAALGLSLQSLSQDGKRLQLLDTGWTFWGDEIAKGNSLAVTVPHTWNVADVLDDSAGYFRGKCFYTRKLSIHPEPGKSYYLTFEGANQETSLIFDGVVVGTHSGGYNAFTFDITAHVRASKQATHAVVVIVNNRFNENIPPLTADFTFFGGIYRSVYLITKPDIHFNIRGQKHSGMYVTTPEVNERSATTNVEFHFTNDTRSRQAIMIQTALLDASGKQLSSNKKRIQSVVSGQASASVTLPAISNPRLWSPENPYLYSVVARILDKKGKVLDSIQESVGFRWFRFSADSGFFLNGKPYKLLGASRHQDFAGMGNAVPKAIARRDVELIKEMGGNFLRTAHYPQDPAVLDACDSLGILVSEEIPVVNTITESEEFYQNCLNMQTEMIRQNRNHPSIIIWGYMNEVLLRPKFNDDKPRQQIYFANILRLAKSLDSLTRKEDPYRYTLISNHGDLAKYTATGLTKVPMLVGWNLYSGWYGGQLEDFGKFMDRFHAENPSTPFLITEYGADADPRIHSATPVRFDKSLEYALTYHEVYLRAIRERAFVSGGAVWCLADFSSETRQETMPHINNKGLMTLDRKPKDLYYFYQSALQTKPFIKIGGSLWNRREGWADSLAPGTSTQDINIYTNTEDLQVRLNGNLVQTPRVVSNVMRLRLPFVNGENLIEVSGSRAGEQVRDAASFDMAIHDLPSFNVKQAPIRLLLGASRIFIDSTGDNWLPAQPFNGSWGYTGGLPFSIKGSNQRYGTDKNIEETFDDPIYQTQIVAIRSFRFDVPDGFYWLNLHFAELAGAKAEALAYNLNNQERSTDSTVRIFDVNINEVSFVERLNLAKEAGIAHPHVLGTQVQVKNKKGLTITFIPVTGEPVLNAIELKPMRATKITSHH